MDDTLHYDAVLEELKNGKKLEGLWLKALTLSDGDENKAKISYVRLRVEQLRQTDSKAKLLSLGKYQACTLLGLALGLFQYFYAGSVVPMGTAQGIAVGVAQLSAILWLLMGAYFDISLRQLAKIQQHIVK